MNVWAQRWAPVRISGFSRPGLFKGLRKIEMFDPSRSEKAVSVAREIKEEENE